MMDPLFQDGAVASNVAPEVTHGLGTADLFSDAQMRQMVPRWGKF